MVRLNQGAFLAIADALERPQLAIPLLPVAVGGGEVGHTALWHFMLHHTTLAQVMGVRGPAGLTRGVERAPAFLQPTSPYDIESGPGGEVGHTALWHFMLHHTTLAQVMGVRGPAGLTRGVERAPAFLQPTSPYDIESGPGGLTREVLETPL